MPDSAPRTDEPVARVIRVFVSSTFRDMVDEREQLAKRVFPALRKLCESRGVVWGEVDLRWGITAEQSEGGEVLPICLDETHRCRPYLIGVLGERYLRDLFGHISSHSQSRLAELLPDQWKTA